MGRRNGTGNCSLSCPKQRAQLCRQGVEAGAGVSASFAITLELLLSFAFTACNFGFSSKGYYSI